VGARRVGGSVGSAGGAVSDGSAGGAAPDGAGVVVCCAAGVAGVVLLRGADVVLLRGAGVAVPGGAAAHPANARAMPGKSRAMECGMRCLMARIRWSGIMSTIITGFEFKSKAETAVERLQSNASAWICATLWSQRPAGFHLLVTPC